MKKILFILFSFIFLLSYAPDPTRNRRVVLENRNRLVPPPISGYSFWFRADGLVAGKDNQYGSVSQLGAVSKLYDLGGSGIYAEQTTGSKQPTLVASATGTKLKKTIQFSSASLTEMDIVNSLSLTNNIGAITIYTVHKVITGGSTQIVVYFSIGGGSTSARSAVGNNASNVNQLIARRVDGDGAAVLTSSTSLTDKNVAAVIDYTNGDGFIYENGALVNSNTSFTSNGNTSSTNSTIAKLGSSAANYLNGNVSEIIVYLGAHNATQIELTYKWLNNYYNLN